jgi:hypothetical protein
MFTGDFVPNAVLRSFGTPEIRSESPLLQVRLTNPPVCKPLVMSGPARSAIFTTYTMTSRGLKKGGGDNEDNGHSEKWDIQ